MTEAVHGDSLHGVGSDDRVVLARAFGLELELPFSMAALPAPRGGYAGTRRTRVVDDGRRGVDSVWCDAVSEQLVVRRFAGGRPMMTVDHDPRIGYRIWAPGHGRHIVSTDGSTVYAAPSHATGWGWQRLFFAQVLPLAAVLQGLEPLHASAIARSGYAVGFAAVSGTGKTSLAAHLIARGATLIADDVLIVEQSPEGPMAHPGAGLIGLAHEQYAELTAEGRPRLGRVLGEMDKLYLVGDPCEHPLPLLALFFLERSPTIGNLTVTRIPSPDPRILLSSSLITYVRDGRRLRQHLDACAKLATAVQLCRVEIPPTARASDVAPVIEDYVDRMIADQC